MTTNDMDALSHAICMGIRKGLFGSDCDDSASILNIEIGRSEDGETIADALREISSSIYDLAEAIRESHQDSA